MIKLLLVFVGGGLGSMARYMVGIAALRTFGPNWPYGTFAVNVIGGFVMGCLAGFLAHRDLSDPERWRIFIGVGILGGFTTFSSFSLDAAAMIERKDYGLAAGYIALSVALSITALFAGLIAARRVFA
jgi:CrcB protein